VPGDTEYRDLGDKDAYEVLGVPRNATHEQIQHEYRQLMEIWHPDSKEPGSRAREISEARAKELNVARRYLTDDRKAYDAFLARRDRARGAGRCVAGRAAGGATGGQTRPSGAPGSQARAAGQARPGNPGGAARARDPWDDFAPPLGAADAPGAQRRVPRPPPEPIWRSRPGRPSLRPQARSSGWRTSGRFFAGLIIAVAIWLIGTAAFFIVFDAVEGRRARHPGLPEILLAIACSLVILVVSVIVPLVIFRRRPAAARR
jgi:curved DNA-binding protein CbpA